MISEMRDGSYSVEVVSWENDLDNVITKYIHNLTLDEAVKIKEVLSMFTGSSRHSNISQYSDDSRYSGVVEAFYNKCNDVGYNYDGEFCMFLEMTGLSSYDYCVRVVDKVRVYKLSGSVELISL